MKSLRLPSRGFFIFPTTPNLSKLRIGDLPINCITTGEASLVISARQRGGRNAPVSCRAYCRPPLHSGRRCHSSSALSRALPSAAFRAAQPYDSPSALRHGANNRPKGHCGPSACQENCSAGARRRRRFWTKGRRPRLHEPPTKLQRRKTACCEEKERCRRSFGDSERGHFSKKTA